VSADSLANARLEVIENVMEVSGELVEATGFSDDPVDSYATWPSLPTLCDFLPLPPVVRGVRVHGLVLPAVLPAVVD
jgi:hypothetical protein